MPPKKSAPKKKDGNPENGGELTQEMQSKMFMLTCQSLQLQLAERSEESSRALLAKRELQRRVDQVTRDFEEEEKQTFEITQDMTRQYKGMQEELLGRINGLEETVQNLSDQLSTSDFKHEKAIREKNLVIGVKDDEIKELKDKMDGMAEEFGEMLRETLEKMRERIEVSSGNFDAPDIPFQHRMDEIRLSRHK